jgi:porin
MLAAKPTLAEEVPPEEPAPGRNLEGPQGVSNQIESDRAARDLDIFELPFLKPYFAWKDNLADETGFKFGIDYTAVGLKSNDSLQGTDDDAAGGILRFFGAWDIVGRGTDTQGSLIYRFGQRHSYTDNAPSDFGLANTGYVGVVYPNHDDRGWILSNLYWRQSWNDGGIILFGGYYDTADFTDVYALGDPFTAFSNLAFLIGAGTIPVPSAGSLGLSAGAWLNDNIYLQGGVTDSNGDPEDPLDGFDTLVNDNEYFTNIEIGWTTSPERAYLDNVHLTLWHVDERDDAGTDDGWGAAFSFSHYFQDRYLPFLKAGYAHDGSSLLEKSVSAGLGYQPQPIGSNMGNLLGVGVNWGEPNSTVLGSGLDDQYGAEVFFRWQLTREIAITPNIQFIRDPALNPDEDSLWLFGLRARLAL